MLDRPYPDSRKKTRPASQADGSSRAAGGRFRVFDQRNLAAIPQISRLSPEQRFEIEVVSSVLPFRVNEYVLGQLIDWDNIPEDPLYQLTFPQPGMLSSEHFQRMADLHRSGADPASVEEAAREIRLELNPHPAGQMELNVPVHEGAPLEGVQHKYRETVLFFPSQGQTCHSYCTFCFRWAQFVGMKELKFAETDASRLHDYLASHREVTDLLLTGGDPMVMKTKVIARYLEPLLGPRFDHVQTIRIGSKSLTFWPQRFVSDADADELLSLLERLVRAGKHVAFMAHLNHWREMETDVFQRAVERLHSAGVVIRSQAPLLRHINDNPRVWSTMWRNQVSLGIVPYYMFVERDTGARAHFEVPLVRAHEVYTRAIQRVSGLARTVRGPSMSAAPGKVEVTGVTEVAGEKVLALRFLQARNPEWVGRPFFARHDEEATWLTGLRPALGEDRWFWQDEFDSMLAARASVS